MSSGKNEAQHARSVAKNSAARNLPNKHARMYMVTAEHLCVNIVKEVSVVVDVTSLALVNNFKKQTWIRRLNEELNNA